MSPILTVLDAWEQFEAICKAMSIPAFYPHPVTYVERRDTHTSAVFLTGAWAYKLKKPVDYSFLDFRSLNGRRYFCEREVELNQRLSHGIYQTVVPIFEKNGKFSLHKNGSAVEYGVKMKQLPDETNLQYLLEKGEIVPEQMEELGRTLARFYKHCLNSAQIDRFGSKEIIAVNMEENFSQLAPHATLILDQERWDFLCNASRDYLSHHEKLFDHRIKTGHIRDGHGDLRSDHIYFHEGLQVIDCIEFNDRFRYGDVVADLAFLHMDLERLGQYDLSKCLLNAYVNEADDPELYGLIDFYATYRATVRLKTTCFRYSMVNDGPEKEALRHEAEHYLGLAYRYSIQFGRPTIWIFCGLPASGKSSLAQQAADTFSIELVQSDYIRKKEGMHVSGRSETPKVLPFGEGSYRQQIRHRVYIQMLTLAQEAVKQGRSLILDATFSSRKWRDEVRRLAADLDSNLIVVECICTLKTIENRLSNRSIADQHLNSFSDARLEHLPKMMQNFEPIEEFSPDMHVRVNTEQPIPSSLAALLSKGYDCKRKQILRLL